MLFPMKVVLMATISVLGFWVVMPHGRVGIYSQMLRQHPCLPLPFYWTRESLRTEILCVILKEIP
jgi:hypothetical protein